MEKNHANWQDTPWCFTGNTRKVDACQNKTALSQAIKTVSNCRLCGIRQHPKMEFTIKIAGELSEKTAKAQKSQNLLLQTFIKYVLFFSQTCFSFARFALSGIPTIRLFIPFAQLCGVDEYNRSDSTWKNWFMRLVCLFCTAHFVGEATQLVWKAFMSFYCRPSMRCKINCLELWCH